MNKVRSYPHQVVDYEHGPTAKAIIAMGWAIRVIESRYNDWSTLTIGFQYCATEERFLRLEIDRYQNTQRVGAGWASSNSEAVELAAKKFANKIYRSIKEHTGQLDSFLSLLPQETYP